MDSAADNWVSQSEWPDWARKTPHASRTCRMPIHYCQFFIIHSSLFHSSLKTHPFHKIFPPSTAMFCTAGKQSRVLWLIACHSAAITCIAVDRGDRDGMRFSWTMDLPLAHACHSCIQTLPHFGTVSNDVLRLLVSCHLVALKKSKLPG